MTAAPDHDAWYRSRPLDSPARIIVAGGEAQARDRAVVLLRRVGFDDVVCQGAFAFDDDSLPPDLVVVVGALVGDLCSEAREVPTLANVPILAITDDVSAALTAGANDVWTAASSFEHLGPGAFTDSSSAMGEAMPKAIDDAIDDMVGDVRSLEAIDRPALGPVLALWSTRLERLVEDGRARREADLLAFMQESMSRIVSLNIERDGVSALREALLIALEVMGFHRASLIAHLVGSETAYVIAATDDPTLYQFTLMVENYPEIETALDTGEPVLIPDVTEDPLTQPVASMLAGTDVRAVAVFPVVWRGRSLGVVMYRKNRPGLQFVGAHRKSFARMFSGHLAGCLRHGHILESLRDQTQRISRARYEAERRLRTIESLKEHFEAAADGVIVLEQSGRILYVNRTAEDITGFARSGLVGMDVGVLVVESQRGVVRQVVEQVIGGHNLEAFDLSLRTTSGEAMWASVTTSTVLSSSGAAILSFRDVTAQRALEAELRKTKEFLEKLVDSTVDAIVAADMRGNVIIFNQGAERMFGYSADEVIGHIPVWELYAEGVPKQVMRMLRSTQYGGVGRLEQTRREILSKKAELVPVNMTASIIYENGREMATVGIFSDLRDRIRIEQRLLRAQEKLQLTEKQAVIAELAGAAAHELNQPLQSIMSYTELLQRKCAEGDPLLRAIEVILSEAERMAEIVRKVGRITKYETTEYVGSTRVINLELSSPGHALPLGMEDSGEFVRGQRLSRTGSSPELPLPSDSPTPAAAKISAIAGGTVVDEFEDEITNQVNVDDLLAGKGESDGAATDGSDGADGDSSSDAAGASEVQAASEGADEGDGVDGTDGTAGTDGGDREDSEEITSEVEFDRLLSGSDSKAGSGGGGEERDAKGTDEQRTQ